MYKFSVTDPYFLPHVGCDIELLVKEGDAIILKGENGLGKTTLLHRFWNENRDYLALSLIPQKPLAVFFDRTLERFKKILMNHPDPTFNPDRFLQLWKKSGFEEKEKRHLSQLSGGENQLLKLCLGLSKKADLFLLDEPGQYLDAEKKSLLHSVLLEFMSEKKSFLIVEHDTKFLPFPCTVQEIKNHEGVIKKGRVWTT